MFYTEKGKPLSQQEFATHYEPYYYIGSASITPKNKTSRLVEEKIDEILRRGVTAEDIPLLIAWKVGIINHAASISSVVYTGDFPCTLIYDDLPYRKNIDVRSMIDMLTMRLGELKELSQTDMYEAYRVLYGMRVPYFGSVKVFTLLYFLSQGRCPIYDKFAEISLDAFFSDAAPGDVIKYKGLPGSVEEDMAKYNEYKKKLEHVFGKSIYEGRSIDRALWVYGHFFSEGKKDILTPNNSKMQTTEERKNNVLIENSHAGISANTGYNRTYWIGTWKQMGAEKFRGTKNGNKPACHEFRLLSTDAQHEIFYTKNLYEVMLNIEERVLILTYWRPAYPRSSVEGYEYQAVEYDNYGDFSRRTSVFSKDNISDGKVRVKSTDWAKNRAFELLHEK